MHEHDFPDWLLAVFDWVLTHKWWSLGLFAGTSAVVAGLVIR
jgi:hypothetical protein